MRVSSLEMSDSCLEWVSQSSLNLLDSDVMKSNSCDWYSYVCSVFDFGSQILLPSAWCTDIGDDVLRNCQRNVQINSHLFKCGMWTLCLWHLLHLSDVRSLMLAPLLICVKLEQLICVFQKVFKRIFYTIVACQYMEVSLMPLVVW